MVVQIRWCAAGFTLSLLITGFAAGQRLAIRSFQTGEGLPNNIIKKVLQDEKGYLWIATAEGLSRYDGYRFVNYGTDDGLGQIFINDIVLDRKGRLWAASNGGGVSMLVDSPPAGEPLSRKKFVSHLIDASDQNAPANAVNRILFDPDNRLWCVTDGGLYRAVDADAAEQRFELIVPGRQPTFSNAALIDRSGNLWFGVAATLNRLVRIKAGEVAFLDVIDPKSGSGREINSIVETTDGRMIVADGTQTFELAERSGGGSYEWKEISIVPAGTHILGLANAPENGLWVATEGMIRVRGSEDRLFTSANGLSIDNVQNFFYDREGNLWIGTSGGGLNKLSTESVVNFTTKQGLLYTDVQRVTEGTDGRVFVQNGCTVTEIRNDKILSPLPASDQIFHENCWVFQTFLPASNGTWWFSTKQGLEYSSGSFLSSKILRGNNGSPVDYTSIYEDPQGYLWITNERDGKLYRVDPGNEVVAKLVAENIPAEFIVRDKDSGTVWLANRARLWRIKGENIEEINEIDGLPVIQPRSLFRDSRGQIWIGTRHNGVIVTDEPEAARPQFRRYSTIDGLPSGSVWEVGEDRLGRIYFGTGRGLAVLDPTTNRFHHFKTDGAIEALVKHLHLDKLGRMWASTDNGIIRIDTTARPAAIAAPPVFITNVRIAGRDLPLPETGSAEIADLHLGPSENNVAIRFIGLSFLGDGSIQYEYKLDGVDENWTLMGDGQREVNYANLGGGSYSFAVRAVNSEGVASLRPATITFSISPPVYLRLWFIVILAVVIASLTYLVYRYRLRQLLAIERTRTRIATDLHDDIGSDLSKISFLSDLARMRGGDDSVERDRLLSNIADISRASVDSMRDIVWAIDPTRDTLLEMTRRMRRHAEDVFAERDVLVEFDAPAADTGLKLSMDARRELFLIFKEAVNNAARHSNCSKIAISLSAMDGFVIMTISDDGCGFSTSDEHVGNGLRNMRLRTERNGGTFHVEVSNGTHIEVRVPRRDP